MFAIFKMTVSQSLRYRQFCIEHTSTLARLSKGLRKILSVKLLIRSRSHQLTFFHSIFNVTRIENRVASRGETYRSHSTFKQLSSRVTKVWRGFAAPFRQMIQELWKAFQRAEQK